MPTEKDVEQSRFFANRVAKRDKHLAKWARRVDTDCYRVYDRDIPEVPVSLDRYGEAAVLYLYERPYDKPEAEESVWLELMATVAAEALRLDRGHIFIKTRKRLGIEEQYVRNGDGAGSRGLPGEDVASERAVREHGLSFIVNLVDYIDTGLFMDHRPARAMVRAMSPGKRVLNLFCYTGSFSVYALAGGATEVAGVDLSNTYLSWAERNVALNGLDDGRYRGVRSDAAGFLAREAGTGRRWDLIILDPPTFSNSKKVEGFLDVARHWPALVCSCLAVLEPGGVIVFSTNARSLRMEPALVPGAAVEDISGRTIPEDFRGHPHRTWMIRKQESGGGLQSHQVLPT
ncbi:MAG: rRNA (guanine-N2)-methyltransferase [Spirochaetae bacterium HGW-Spirochaetae-7]|nr:MAG: rRNA (guanine-N2)-methyltransferase [Spirochaetae bacterium HGW-Spirochaetae-7]